MSELEEIQGKYIRQQSRIARILKEVDAAVYWADRARTSAKRNSKTSVAETRTHINRAHSEIRILRNKIQDILSY